MKHSQTMRVIKVCYQRMQLSVKNNHYLDILYSFNMEFEDLIVKIIKFYQQINKIRLVTSWNAEMDICMLNAHISKSVQ